jgi:hypothetical protein
MSSEIAGAGKGKARRGKERIRKKARQGKVDPITGTVVR